MSAPRPTTNVARPPRGLSKVAKQHLLKSPVLQAHHQHPFVRMDMPTLLAQRAQARRDHPFVVWEPFQGEPSTWTYGQFHDQAGRIAAGLLRRGVVAGDRVLIHLENCPEALLAWHACVWVGAIAVTTNSRAA